MNRPPKAEAARVGSVAAPPAVASPDAVSAEPRQRAAAASPGTRTSKQAEEFRQILGGLEGAIPPVRATLTYRLGILLAAAFMVLLPLVYLAMIAAVGFGVCFHAVNDVEMLSYGRGKGRIAVLLLYLAPIVVGALLVLFMLKPLLSRPPVRERRRSLRREQQPLLFAFVDRVCEAVGAPAPTRIDLDCQVNASASFRRGMMSFLGRDLVLTIGLPLVAGMSLRQFAGVLAHEFGHFAQGSGMRLTYVVRSINAWFYRVVFERDQWDERLVEWSHTWDVRISWIFYLTRGFVWLTRKVLQGLMMAGHAVTGYMSREMEFDADRYEARLAGSDTFETTSRRLRELGLGHQGAMFDLRSYYREGRLADDVPALIVANADQIPAAVKASIEEHLKTAKAKWFESHPGDADRIASARREKAPGIVRVERPAAALFADFPELCRHVTLDMYREIFGDEFDRGLIHSTETLVKRTESEQSCYEALGRFFQGTYHPLRPVGLPRYAVAAPENAKATAEELKAARDEMAAGLPACRAGWDRFREAEARRLCGAEAWALHAAGLSVKADRYPTDLSTAEKAKQGIDAARADRKKAAKETAAYEAAAGRRLAAALDLLAVPKVIAKVAGGEQARAEADRLLAAAEVLARQAPNLLKMNETRRSVAALFAALEGRKQITDEHGGVIKNHLDRLAGLVGEVRGELDAADYPFDHARGKVTIAEVVGIPNGVDPTDPATLYRAAESAEDEIARLLCRVVGRLCERAEEVEKLLGLSPLPQPEADEPTATA